MKNKHLNFEERVTIEECLDKKIKVAQIAKRLGRPSSTIVREIKRNAYRKPMDGVPCAHMGMCEVYGLCDNKCRTTCSNCSEGCKPSVCPEYLPRTCERLKKSPFVCNGCDGCAGNRIRFARAVYRAKHAQMKYLDTLKDSRTGISLSPEEMETMDGLVSPLLDKGQSIKAVFISHGGEIPCSERTLYDYIDRGYLTAKNVDMPRKVRFKARYNHGPRTQSFQKFAVRRTYADFKEHMEKNPDANVWEMDTVIGTVEDKKCILTLLFRKTSFMLAFLLQEHTQECVINALNGISATIGIELFQKLFQVILCDRGTEFGNPYAMECDENGEIKTRIYYCDSYCSWQKGRVENNHEFLRRIIPKGKSFARLSQSDVHLMMLHINSYPRESLNDNSPYEVSQLLLGKAFLEKMGYRHIHPDEVMLKPALLTKR